MSDPMISVSKMGTFKVGRIQKMTVNNWNVKFFEVRRLLESGAWGFFGNYLAPVRTANKNLLWFFHEKRYAMMLDAGADNYDHGYDDE